MNTRLERKKQFIRALAEYLVENEVGKSLSLELARKHPPIPPVPNWASEWRRVRELSPLFGYTSVEKAEKELQEFLM